MAEITAQNKWEPLAAQTADRVHHAQRQRDSGKQHTDAEIHQKAQAIFHHENQAADRKQYQNRQHRIDNDIAPALQCPQALCQIPVRIKTLRAVCDFLFLFPPKRLIHGSRCQQDQGKNPQIGSRPPIEGAPPAQPLKQRRRWAGE